MSGVAARASVAATTPQVAARSTGCSGSVNALGPQAENKRAAPAAVTEILMSLASFRPFRPANEQWTPLFRRTQMRSEEHTSELQSLMRISYAVFCLKKKKEAEKKSYREIKT